MSEKNKLQPTLQFLRHICDIFARSKFVLETLVKAKPQRQTSEGQSDLSLTWISKIFNTKFAPRNLVANLCKSIFRPVGPSVKYKQAFSLPASGENSER